MIRGVRESMRTAPGAIVLAVLLATGVLAGCGPAEVGERAPVVRPIKMMEVGSAVSAVSRAYPGRIAPALEADVSFEVAGRLVDFPVSEGQRVRKGQLIAQLDASNFEAQLTAAQADVNAAKADFDRFQELLEKSAVSQRDFESRKRNYEVAQARLEIADKGVADTRLIAPFRGRVARKLVDDYQNVRAKQPVVLLQSESQLQIKIDIPEADVILGSPDRLPDLKPMVSVTAFPGRSFPARVAEVSTAADPVTRTFEATLSFTPDDDVNILPGMTARIALSVDKPGATSLGQAIPSRSVATGDAGGTFVWVIDPESWEVRRATVEVGELTGSDIIVRSGLSPGDLIAVTGVHHLRDGMKVRRLEEG